MQRARTAAKLRVSRRYRPLLERLERRIVFASDFGDAPLPYKTLLAEGGAEHVAIGPMLGASRDTEADGVHSAGADGDDTAGVDDEDGVTFGTIRTGALDATVTVNVQGGAAKLDAWIDFNGDGSWGGPGEQIADTVAVVTGDNVISFDVPSWARDGTTYARLRLNTTGNLGVAGAAADGEVEDHALFVMPPAAACGCFGAPNTLSPDGAFSVYAIDVDGDDDTDALSASSEDDKIAWYENVGDSDFLPHTITLAAAGATSFHATDVDSDGDTDVLSASRDDDRIAWYENDGNEEFTTHTISTSADKAYSVFALDLDGDGDTDVLSASYLDAKIAWYENDGNQAFTEHSITTGALGARSVFAVDVDGDSDVDVLSASTGNNTIAWYENDGSQNFGTHIISDSANHATSVFAADVDSDGDMDVLSASQDDDRIVWYEYDGFLTFVPHIITASADGARSVFAADADGDGDIDVFSASYRDETVAWYENDGNQVFTKRTLSTTMERAYSVFAADVDGDGDTDVLSASHGDDTLAWYENDASQQFTVRDIAVGANGAWTVHAADVDSDGDMDVLSASYLDDKIAWYENNGNEEFIQRVITQSANGATGIYASDMDADSDIDVLIAASVGADGIVAWFENDGNQNFTSHIIHSGANYISSVYAADVDSDGDMDILSASSSFPFGIDWWENDGTQNFRHFAIYNAGFTGYLDVRAADVDGDGDMDVLSASRNEDEIAWYENDGNQSFARHAYTAAKWTYEVDAADVDGDGDMDMVSASYYAPSISWWENDGNANFVARPIVNTDLYAESIQAADIDGDGDIDVLAGVFDENNVIWYENDGSENFVGHTIAAGESWVRDVSAADVDGDGDLDVLSASWLGDRIAWYKNLNFKVVNANDYGPGSLRLAIQQANANPGLDTITFAIGTGPQTIAPSAGLPDITDAVIIDGTTQPGYVGTPIVEIWGGAVSSTTHGLVLTADNSTIKGLVVNLFPGNGILITGHNNRIENTYIGTDISGTIAVPNAVNGIEIAGGFNNTIGAVGAGNIIAFNDGHGILVDAGTNNAIRQNSIHSNDGLGIDLINAGNNNQRAPSVNSAVAGGGTTSIAASLALVVPSTTYTIEFFSSAVCDPSGFGEGETYLGTKTLTTTATGRGRTMFVVGFEIPVGHVITATATSPFNDTSEFSMCRVVTAGLAPGGNGPNPPPLRPSSETRFLQETGLLATLRERRIAKITARLESVPDEVSAPTTSTKAIHSIARPKLSETTDPLLDVLEGVIQ